MSKSMLGEYIEQVDVRNFDGTLGENSVIGISTQKSFIFTKADLTDVSLTSYKKVLKNCFVYVPDTSRRGDKMALAYNRSEKIYLVSAIYTVFRVKEDSNNSILSEYLFLYFNRPEFDRYARFHSWGSAREVFSWDDMCDIEIELPSVSTQQKYVGVYNALLANQRTYENSLEDLNTAISANIEEFKHTAQRVPVGKLLDEIDVRNRGGKISNVQGININKEFMPSVANLSETDLTKYKVIEKNQFAANFMHVMRDRKIPFSLYHEDKSCIISPAYFVFMVKSNDVLAEYLMLWINREESDRYAWFISDSSIRGGLELLRFFEIEIPLPSIPQQEAVVNFYNARNLIQRNIVALGSMLKDICPVLVKGAVGEV